ncbi:olfactory receptor 52E8-like isoform X2 [Pleurodeles waltl]|uniref:olfactory receptor 52E8-like isoform X2 n=1 Tax=Pleurodeles waltl TaxID=8319 RepID=UPI003709419C
MSSLNSSRHPSTFILMGIPGMEDYYHWIAIPLCLMYIIALIGNIGVLLLIITVSSLHEPMYIFLSMLSVTDLILPSSALPKTLGIFWFNSKSISFQGCLAQVFFIHFIHCFESAILLAMAYDRHVAICDPLRYAMKFTNNIIRKLALLGLVRSFCAVAPLALLLHRLPYCQNTEVPHTYCEHMGIARLACADVTVNSIFGLTSAISSMGLDAVFVIASYVLILRTVLKMNSLQARQKAFSTCTSHICVIILFYVPAFFSFFAHRFGKNIPRNVHIFVANIYIILPSMLNPVIYCVSTKKIRQIVHRLFH